MIISCAVSPGVAANQTCISGATSLLAVFDTRCFSLECLRINAGKGGRLGEIWRRAFLIFTWCLTASPTGFGLVPNNAMGPSYYYHRGVKSARGTPSHLATDRGVAKKGSGVELPDYLPHLSSETVAAEAIVLT